MNKDEKQLYKKNQNQNQCIMYRRIMIYVNQNNTKHKKKY